jgi:hypothetical protein
MITADDPRHGERAGYLAGCREMCCRVPHTRYGKQWNLDQAAGRPKRQVPATRAQEHITHLLRMMSVGAIADAAGVAETIVTGVLSREVIYARTERRILGVTKPTQASGRHRVNITGSVRRLRALAAVGYSSRAIAAASDLSACSIRLIQQEKSGETVEAATARAVVAAYDTLAMTPPIAHTPKARQAIPVVKRHAERQGWVPPLAWDDTTIDDPAATPTGAGYVEPTLADQIRELADMGLTEPAICDRLAAKPSTVQRTLERSKERAA